MGLALAETACRFELHVRCANCHKETIREFLVPIDRASMDVDELLMSEAVNRVPYSCHACGGVVARIFGVRRV